MRALAKTGPPSGALELLERDIPRIGREDVLVRVVACGICGSDLAIHDADTRLFAASFPQWLGHEYTGIVEAVGEDVTSVTPGDRVTAEPSSSCGACPSCRAGATNVCPNRAYHGGGFADYVAVSQDRVHLLPPGVPWHVGALSEPLACADHAVHEIARVASGDTCAVIGAGPVGLVVALTLRAAGAETVIIARPGRAGGRIQLARQIGLDSVEAGNCIEARALLAARGWIDGADVTFDCAGGESAVAVGLGITSARGRYVEVALTHAPLNIDLDKVVTRELRLLGSVSHTRASWINVFESIGKGTFAWSELTRVVTDVFALADWRHAFDVASQRTRGKVLVAPRVEVMEATA